MRTTTLDVSGPFALEEVALMGFGHRDEQAFDGVMRLAFCLDGDLEQQVGVELRQDGQRLDLVVHGEGDLEAVRRQVARVVSADHDGAAFDRVCQGDPVLSRVHAVAPGFRPCLFHSAYEAAVWSVLSARRQRRQAIGLRAHLSAQHGRTFELAGEQVHALPTPSTLAALPTVSGLQEAAVPRLQAVAEAAARGDLDTATLRGLDPTEAGERLQRLPGVGPFYAALVVVRALGHADVLSTQEDHSREAVRELYGLDHLPSTAELEALADGWRPFRTWAAVMLRALSPRLPGRDGVAG